MTGLESDARCVCGHLARHHVAGELRCPVLDVTTGEKCACPAWRQPCDDEPLMPPTDQLCQLSNDHQGAHMHFTSNGVRAWELDR